MNELTYQKIWKRRGAGRYELLSGKTVHVVHSGAHNHGDGPDFSGACVQPESGLRLLGGIELHLHEEDWYRHGHHNDPAYNRVLLHIVAESGKRRAIREDGIPVPTVLYRPEYNRLQKQDQPICAPHIHLIRPGIVEEQFQRAHREYFERKTEDMLSRYPRGKTVSDGWKTMLILSLGNALGISANREPLEQMARWLTEQLHLQPGLSPEQLFENAYSVSGLGSGTGGEILPRQAWDLSGCRPGNKPGQRLRQLVSITLAVNETRLSSFYRSPLETWRHITAAVPEKSHRLALMYTLIYLPSLYLLGNLLAHDSLRTGSYHKWLNSSLKAPKAVINEFRDSGFPLTPSLTGLGGVYQHREYCGQNRCESCLIGKRLPGLG